MAETDKYTVENLCRDARVHLNNAAEPLFNASHLASETDNHELRKSLDAVMGQIETLSALLTTLPRLKG